MVEEYATIEQDQIPEVRVGELPEIKMRREEGEVHAEEKEEEPGEKKGGGSRGKEEKPKKKAELEVPERRKSKARMMSRDIQRDGFSGGNRGKMRKDTEPALMLRLDGDC